MKNLEVAQIFRQIAKILEIKGDNPFRIRAYERAAQNIEGLSQDIENFVKEDKLRQIPGIGQDLENKIKEIVQTGKLQFLLELEKSIPAGVLELLNIPSIGPKTAQLLYKELKIESVEDLEEAIKKNKLLGLAGIKEKSIENIQRGIDLLKKGQERMLLSQASLVAQEFINALQKLSEVKKISCAGSLRRQKETVRDIDILVVSNYPEKVIDTFTKLPQVKNVQAKGETKSSVLTYQNIQVDLRVVEDKSFGAALLYFTGSKNFNIKLRKLALKKRYKVNEYGLFYQDKYLAGRTEEELFKKLGLVYIVPELREDTGEIELAQKNKLPQLVELKDIKGDLHVHSDWSDGANSISELAQAAKKRGYAYIAITDHSQSLKVAQGLSVADLSKKKRQIDKINASSEGIKVLFGTEVEIDADGDIDYKNEILKEFDVVVAAIHSGFKQSKEQLTRRIIKACKNKYVHIIAHPTGRLWGTRSAYAVDFEEIFKVAADTHTALEINSFPQRLDLNDINARAAAQAGVKLVVSTDAHNIEQLNNISLGISVARRAWLGKKDILNTLSLESLLKSLQK